MTEMAAKTKAWEFDNDPQPGIWFSRFNVQEMTSDVVTPLTWSTSWWAIDQGAQRALVMSGVRSEPAAPFAEAPFFFGRPWWRHGDAPSLAREAQQQAGALARMRNVYRLPVDEIPDLAAVAPQRSDDHAPDLRAGPAMLQMAAAIAGEAALQRLPVLEAEVIGRRRELLDGAASDLGDSDLADALLAAREQATACYCELIRVAGCATLSPMAMSFALAELGESDPEATAQALLAGASGVRSADISERLWEVHEGAATWEAFLDEFGARGNLEVELESKPWRMDDRPARALLSSVASGTESPAAARRSAAEAAATRREELRTRYAGNPMLEQLETCADLGRRFVPAREWTKHVAVLALDSCRAVSVEAGARTGLGDDVFYATIEELVAALHGSGALPGTATIERRRAERESCRGFLLPDSFCSYPQPLESPPSVGGEDLSGLGIYPGRVRAAARVLNAPEDGFSFERGEVLVAPITDVAWTPLFTIAGAVVVENGSRESHAAIVARELGVPTVVNVRWATQRIRTGDIVEVDASLGTVHLTGERLAVASAVGEASAGVVVVEAPPAEEVDLDSAAWELLHELRLRGRMEAADGAEVSSLEAAGYVASADGELRITSAGRAADAGWARAEPGSSAELAARQAYDFFTPLNRRLLQLVSDWQQAAGDAEAEWGVLDRLADLDRQVGPLLRHLASELPRFGAHRQRLRAALQRATDGESAYVASPLADSYHTVWMQVHEDLLAVLGISRREEAEGAL